METTIDDRSFSLGSVFTRASSVMVDNPVVTFGTAFFLEALPNVLFTHLLPSSITRMPERNTLLPMAGSILLAFMLFLVLPWFVQGCLARATVADSEGRRADFGECLGAAMNHLLPLIGASLLLTLFLIIGLVLFIIPAILIGVTFAVVIPVIVEERVGVVEALGRASDLTRGVRWKIFSLLILMFVVTWLMTVVAGQFRLMIAGLPDPFGLTAGAAIAVSSTIQAAFWATMVAGLYVELREWKDGPATQHLSEIFA